MVVLGLVAIDHAIAMAEYQAASSPGAEKRFPSFLKVMLFYITNRDKKENEGFQQGLTNAVQKLAKKSQSMHMGSVMFQGPLRIDLILLYVYPRKSGVEFSTRLLG